MYHFQPRWATNTVFAVSDTSGNKETVEVGVIVIGLCCICLVACALVFLQLRSNNRRIRGNRQRSANLDGGSGDQTRDPLDIEAPPSYDAGTMFDRLFSPVNVVWLTTSRKHHQKFQPYIAFICTCAAIQLTCIQTVPLCIAVDEMGFAHWQNPLYAPAVKT